MKDWQKVFWHDQPHKAELVKATLESSGLKPVLVNKQDSSYNNFGSYEIYVSPDQVLRAIKIINNDINFK